MNTRQKERYVYLYNALDKLGIADQIDNLLQIERKLHKWGERECNGEIEQDETTGKWYARTASGNTKWRIPNGEAIAIKRLTAIIKKAKRGTRYYYQSDPRGCAVYIIRRGDIPADANVESCYTRGIAICL
jgi:hypothetical protein